MLCPPQFAASFDINLQLTRDHVNCRNRASLAEFIHNCRRQGVLANLLTKSTLYFSALILTLSPQPPYHETPCPSLSAQPWGAEKLLFPRTKYSNNKVQQRRKTITLKNLKCIQASGLWYANNKLHQRTIVDLPS